MPVHFKNSGRAGSVREEIIALIHDYIVDLASRLLRESKPILLDYGCGAGEIVKVANAGGMDAYGVDVFYKGGDASDVVTQEGLLGTRIFRMENGVIPFGEAKFVCVTSNQVFEHIDDFSKPLEEINRVLKPGGVFINLFPTSEVWREGHIGIPFIHWFSKGTMFRYVYALALRSVGMGYHKKIRSPSAWTRNYLNWIDNWTYYKSFAVVRKSFEKYFIIHDWSHDYLLYRLEQHRNLRSIAKFFRPTIFIPFLRFFCHRFSGRVFVLYKK